MRRKCQFSISITIFHPKNTQTERSYMICIPHQARLVLPLTIYSWVHCTQLCIIHQAFLSTEQVFLIHTRHHFKLTRKAFVPELQPLIGHFRHSNHRQQQEHGTRVCRRIRITSWHCQQMLKSATDAVTCSQKNFVRHHTTSWSSMWIGVWYTGTTTQGRWCTAQTLPTPITIPTLHRLDEKTLSLTAVY